MTGVGLSEASASGIVGGVALVALVGAPISGAIGDRIGLLRLMLLVLPFYGLGLLVPAFTQATGVHGPDDGAGRLRRRARDDAAVRDPAAADAPRPARRPDRLLQRQPRRRRALGPLLAGLAIQLLADPFASTDGYAAMWLVCGTAVLLSVWPTRTLARLVKEA